MLRGNDIYLRDKEVTKNQLDLRLKVGLVLTA